MFREAMLGGATAVVVFHNHPSGDPSPSPDDVALTRAAGGGRDPDGHRARRSRRARRRAVLQFQGDGTALVSRVLYFDCFSGISGDMVLGALLDAGLPLDDLTRALGSLARVRVRDPRGPRAARRRLGHQARWSIEHGHASAWPTAIDHDTPARRPSRIRIGASAEIFALIDTSALLGSPRPRARQGAVPATGGGRSRHPSDAGRAGASARGRRARLDHRHRRRRVRAGVGRRRPHRLLAAQRRRRHGAVGARHASCAGAGDASGCSGTRRSTAVRSRRSWSRRPVRCSRQSYAERFGPLPAMTIERIGYGAGERDIPGTPNVLRVFIGRATDRSRTASGSSSSSARSTT